MRPENQKLPELAPKLPFLNIYIVSPDREEQIYFKHLVDCSIAKYEGYRVHLEDSINFTAEESSKNIILLMLDETNNPEEILNNYKNNHPYAALIVITDISNEQIGVKALELGAQDYIIKDVITSRSINRTIRNSLERKRIEKHLKNITKTMEEFAFTVAHNIQGPLASVLLAVESIENDENKLEDYCPLIKKTIHKISDLTKGLLDYAKSVHEINEFLPIDLTSLITDIINEFNLKDNTTIDKLPIIYGTQSLIAQLFTNLISNASKYRDPIKPLKLEIFSSPCKKNKNYYDIIVKDNGTGIDKNFLTEAFTPFKRFHHDIPGNGIGLSMCKKIAQSHRGDIKLQSDLGQGSIFTITLPITIL